MYIHYTVKPTDKNNPLLSQTHRLIRSVAVNKVYMEIHVFSTLAYENKKEKKGNQPNHDLDKETYIARDTSFAVASLNLLQSYTCRSSHKLVLPVLSTGVCIQVNDVSLSEATCEDALAALQHPSPFIHLTLRRDHNPEPLPKGSQSEREGEGERERK